VARCRHCKTGDQLHVADKTFDVDRDGNKPVRDCGFMNGDNLVFVHGLHGGSALRPWDGHVWLTKDPCCVTDDDDPNEWRAQLACKHAVGRIMCSVSPQKSPPEIF